MNEKKYRLVVAVELYEAQGVLVQSEEHVETDTLPNLLRLVEGLAVLTHGYVENVITNQLDADIQAGAQAAVRVEAKG